MTCKIEIKPNSKPVRCRPHRASPKQREIIEAEVEKLLDLKVIEPCDSPYASPCMLVPKTYDKENPNKVTSHRLVIDYRQLNNNIVDNTYPLPIVADLLDSLGSGGKNKAPPKYFTTLDLMQGYYQIALDEESQNYTTFTTHSGLYKFKRMPMGLKSSIYVFMRVMNNLFRHLLYKGVLIYLDDLIIYSDTLEEHLKLLQQVFDVKIHRLIGPMNVRKALRL